MRAGSFLTVMLMPLASPFCRLIGGGLIGVGVMPDIVLVGRYLYTKDTVMYLLCRDTSALILKQSGDIASIYSSFSREKLE